MLPVSEAFTAAIGQSHTPLTSVTLDGTELPILDGSVTLDGTAATRASVNLTLAVGDVDLADWVPDSPESLLAPYGNEIVVRRGVTFPDGTGETVPLGVFRIDETSVDDSGDSVTLSVTALDRSAQMIDAVFESAGATGAGLDAAEVIQFLMVVGGYEGDFADDFLANSVTVPALSFEAGDDRWDFCQGLAEAVGGSSLYFDGEGVCCLRKLPDSTSIDYTVSEGGVLLSASKSWGRENACNRVLVTGENGNDDPVVGVAIDDTPGSPTNYYASDFGRVTFAYSSEYVTDTDQANDVAERILSLKLGTGQQINFDSLVNPALEPGDVVEVVRERIGISESHVIDSLTIPLTADGAMSCTTRVTRIG